MQVAHINTKASDLVKEVPPVERLGTRVSVDLIEASIEMSKEEIQAVFAGLDPWFLEPGFKGDTYAEGMDRVVYIPLLEDDIKSNNRFGFVCYVRYSRTKKTYQLIPFCAARKAIDAHIEKEERAFLEDIKNGHDGEA
jgi:hypothetical protein